MKRLAFLSVLTLIAAGCQQDASTQRKPGTYSAARYSQTGSNIPRPYSATTVGSTYDPEQFSNVQNQESSAAGRAMAGGVGGGGR